MASFDSLPVGVVEVKLDGVAVEVPAERRSFSAIRSYLEALALKQQRILCALVVDGEAINLSAPRPRSKPVNTIEGETMSLDEVPMQLINAALQQAISVRGQLQSAVTLVLINDSEHARELWWELAIALKEPLLTLSLIPETAYAAAPGTASLSQLRKWQLEQLGRVIQELDECCDAEDPIALSEALETRALPWLDKLHDSLKLWLEKLLLESSPRTPGASVA